MALFDLAQLPGWLHASWAQLQALATQPPPALLLVSPATGDAEGLATLYARHILCEAESSAQRPCGQCRSCREWAGGVHPDYLRVARPADKREISVDAIRSAMDWTARTARRRHRVLHLAYAETMNKNAANAFLKTLEEPPAGVLMVLSASQFHSLPMTLRSRCLRLTLPPPAASALAQWLTTQGLSAEDVSAALQCAPGDALQGLQAAEWGALEQVQRWRAAWKQGVVDGEPLGAAAVMDADDWPEALRWCQRQILRWAQGQADASVQHLEPAWAAAIRLRALHGIALNRLLAAEELFILLRKAYLATPYSGDLTE